MIFCKYEFEPTIWESLKQTIQKEIFPEKYGWAGCSVVEIGRLCKEWGEDEQQRVVCKLQSDKISVDILWDSEIPEQFNQYEVFPDPCGIHSFAGLEDFYKQRFCQFNPNSTHCDVNENNQP